jgi:glycosyltransferase involved in cell wall biosynthesis
MRILFCNKYNFPFSGTEVYLFELMELLRSQGHEVALFSMADPRGKSTPFDRHFVPHIDFKDRRGVWQRAKQAAHALYSTEARRKLRAMILDFKPDLAHVRNIYHHLSPSILFELKEQRIPVIYHLNDFKLLCPSYNLVSEGESCEACKGGAFWHAIQARCYPGFGARVTLVAEAYTHRWLRTYRKCIDLFLAPSKFVRDKFVEHGWDGGQFEVLPHFQSVPDHEHKGCPTGDHRILYIGRLSSEKGIADVLQAMVQLPHVKLVVAGDGPQRLELEQLKDNLQLANVEFVGQVGPAQRDLLIAQSLFTVMPSHAYETLGKTILESYAQGRPVVASDRGSRRELVRHGATGLLYRCGDVNQLAQSIGSLASSPDVAASMGRAGRAFVQNDHSPASHYQKLLTLYEGLTARSEARKVVPVLPMPARYDRVLDTAQSSVERHLVAPKRPLRIAFIGGRGVVSKYSGIEAYYEEVGKQLAAKGHEITVYCRNYFTPAIGKHNGMRLVRLPTIRTKHLETVVHTFLSTAHAITQGYDLVHFHALGPALFSFIPRIFGMKTAVTVQGLDWQRKKWGKIASGVLQLGEQASVGLPNATMVVSRTLQERYGQEHSAKPFYVPNGGILRDKSQPSKILEWGLEPGKYVLFLGRFSPEKGCHLLVEAFEQIDTDAKLVMAGASSYCDEYSRELRTHASERIRMLDWVSGQTLDELLTNSMIFVLPSDMEGLSLALLDAMGAGLCVLTSDVPENREAVEGAGFTFQAGNSSDLADRLRFLIANPSVRETAGRTARQRVEEEYQWEKIAADIEQVYLRVLGSPTGGISRKKPGVRAEIQGHNNIAGRRAG